MENFPQWPITRAALQRQARNVGREHYQASENGMPYQKT
jgi:hypothetical protein